jgi:hypothetical protein
MENSVTPDTYQFVQEEIKVETRSRLHTTIEESIAFDIVVTENFQPPLIATLVYKLFGAEAAQKFLSG